MTLAAEGRVDYVGVEDKGAEKNKNCFQVSARILERNNENLDKHLVSVHWYHSPSFFSVVTGAAPQEFCRHWNQFITGTEIRGGKSNFQFFTTVLIHLGRDCWLNSYYIPGENLCPKTIILARLTWPQGPVGPCCHPVYNLGDGVQRSTHGRI